MMTCLAAVLLPSCLGPSSGGATGSSSGGSTSGGPTSGGSTNDSTTAVTTSGTSTTTIDPEATWTTTLWQPIEDLGGADSNSFLPSTDLGDLGCSLWLGDCPEGQKCIPQGWGHGTCGPLARVPGGFGDACIKETCGEGLYCASGWCRKLCSLDLEAPCQPNEVCPSVEIAWPPLCFERCDPVYPECFKGEICQIGPGGFHCATTVLGSEHDKPLFADCKSSNSCALGLFCAEQGSAAECAANKDGCCVPFCDLMKPNTCPGQGQTCVPLYKYPLPGLEHVGLCEQ